MNTPCLLIIDVQQTLIDEGPADPDAFLDRVATLLNAARQAGAPVVFIQHDGPSGDTLEPGQPGWQIHPAVRPLADEPVFRKRYNSAFLETGLEGWLRERGIGALVAVGMQTEYCMDASIKSAFEKGFRVTVPEGAHTTCDNGGLSGQQIRDFYQELIWRGRYAACPDVGAAAALFRVGSEKEMAST